MGAKLSFWGIDGCKTGWFCVGLGADDEYKCFVGSDIEEVYRRLPENAKIVLIDIPIGLSDNLDERSCDRKARKYVGERRRSSVFRVPCRQAVEVYRNTQGDSAAKRKAGKIASVKVTDGCLSEQTWGIVEKIGEVDDFLNCQDEATKQKRRKLFREVHPEVCFRALNDNKDIKYSKKKSDGLEERVLILEKHFPQARKAYECYCDKIKRKEVAKDDILDALATALTAKIGFGEDGSELATLRTLPSSPLTDSCGLPMEMLYVEL